MIALSLIGIVGALVVLETSTIEVDTAVKDYYDTLGIGSFETDNIVCDNWNCTTNLYQIDADKNKVLIATPSIAQLPLFYETDATQRMMDNEVQRIIEGLAGQTNVPTPNPIDVGGAKTITLELKK